MRWSGVTVSNTLLADTKARDNWILNCITMLTISKNNHIASCCRSRPHLGNNNRGQLIMRHERPAGSKENTSTRHEGQRLLKGDPERT